MGRHALFAVALALAACGSKPGDATLSNRPVAAKETLGQMLEREVGAGAAVAIVAGANGLRAISADGARTRVLVPKATWTLVDNRSRVVWFGDDPSKVFAIDLDGPSAAGPVVKTVATGLPLSSGAGGTLVAIRHESKKEELELPAPFSDLQFGGRLQPRVVVVIGKTPSLDVSGGILDVWGQTDEFANAVKQARLLEQAWLADLAERGRDGSFSLIGEASPGELTVPGVDPSNCQYPERCGQAEPIPRTKLWRVAVSLACGDGCYTGWRLYDPAAKQFLDGDWAREVSDVWVAKDGSAFVRAGVVTRFDRGPLAGTPPDGGEGGGWLGGAYHLF